MSNAQCVMRNLRFFATLRMTTVFPCHSEERSDEESNSFFKILRSAQNDI